MVKHLEAVLETNGWLDSRQFGFVTGCGTEDASNCLARVVRVLPRWCVVGLFLDISGTFDDFH